MNVWLAQSKWELTRMVRNRRFFFFTLAIPLFYYFLFVKLNGAHLQVSGTTWNAYFMMSMAAFSVIGTGLNGMSGRLAFERTQGWLRLIQTTPLPARTYVGSKVLAQFGAALVSALILFLAGTVFEGVRLGAGQWVMSLLWLAVGSLPFILLGTIIGLVAGAEASNMIGSAIYLIISLLGGLWWPVQSMPSLLQQIAKAMPSYCYADITWHITGWHAAPLRDYLSLLCYLIGFGLVALWLARRNRDINL